MASRQHGATEDGINACYETSLSMFAGVARRRRRPPAGSNLPTNRQPLPWFNNNSSPKLPIQKSGGAAWPPPRDTDDTDQRGTHRYPSSPRLRRHARATGIPASRSPASPRNTRARPRPWGSAATVRFEIRGRARARGGADKIWWGRGGAGPARVAAPMVVKPRSGWLGVGPVWRCARERPAPPHV